MKKLLKAAMAALLAAMMFGCSSEKADTTKILIGTSPDYPPYESLNDDGELEGFDIEMAEWIVNYMNDNGEAVELEWTQMSFDTIVSAVTTNQVDLGISGFNYSEERAEQVSFSVPYYGSSIVLVVNADSEIKSLDDLKGKTIGAQLGSTDQAAAEEFANDLGGNTQVKNVIDVKVLMEDLKSNGIDAVALDLPVANEYAKSGSFVVLDEIRSAEDGGFFIIGNKDNQELMDKVDEAVNAFLLSDDYQAMVAKWLEEE